MTEESAAESAPAEGITVHRYVRFYVLKTWTVQLSVPKIHRNMIQPALSRSSVVSDSGHIYQTAPRVTQTFLGQRCIVVD